MPRLFKKGVSGNPGGRKRTGETISSHLEDLLLRDARKVKEIAAYLSDKNSLAKITAARLIAANMIIQAMERSEFTREILDRSEGRVAERLNVNITGEFVHRLESARQRILAHISTREVSQDSRATKALPPGGESQS